MPGAIVTTQLSAAAGAAPPAPESATPQLSVIVPLFNEERSIGPLYEAIVTALAGLHGPFEMVFVDDGSSDDTVAVATSIARSDSRLRIVKFRRNYGQTAAMAAGIEHARGEILITLDGDLQNDPRDIPLLLQAIAQGSDLVVGWRHDRQDKLVSRRVPSRIANWLIGKVTGVPIHDNGCSLKAFRAGLIKSIPLYSEMHRFIPAMASIAGPRVAEIKVRHHARRYGQSKYGLSRVYKVLLDLMVIKTVATFACRPLRWFALLALPLIVPALAALGHIYLHLVRYGTVPLPMAGTAVILFASAAIMLCSGALAELIYLRGDVRDRDFMKLTSTVHAPDRQP